MINLPLYPTATRQYIEARQARLRSSGTRRSVESALSLLQAAHPGHGVGNFTEAELVTWLNKPTWAPATVARYRSVVVTFFRWAAREGLVDADPASFLPELVNPRVRSIRPVTWLEDAEIHELLAASSPGDLGLRDKVALALPLFTGLRVAEFAAPPRGNPDRGLSWGRVRRDTIRVFGKGEKWDTVGVSPELAALLTEWRTLYEDRLGRPVGLHDPILCRAWEMSPAFGQGRQQQVFWGKGLGPGGIRALVHRYGARIGYPELAPHDLRRTFAFSLKRAGVPVEDISAMLRHDNIGTTQRYLKADKSALAGHWAKVGAGA